MEESPNFRFQNPFLKQVFKSVYFFIVGLIILVPLVLFIVVVQLPIILYRLLLTKFVVRFFRPRIGKAVTVNGQFLATEFRNRNKPRKQFRYAIVLAMILEGDVSMEELSDLIMKRWVQRKLVGDGEELRYPEFQQYIGQWMGFMFWKQDPKFDLRNHIFYHELDKLIAPKESKQCIDLLLEDLLNKPFPLQRSPWEVHLIRNYKTSEYNYNGNMTAILLRFHHAMVDGHSFTHIVSEGLLEENGRHVRLATENKIKNIPREEKSPVNLWEPLLLPFRFFVDLGFIMNLFWSYQSPWKLPQTRSDDLEKCRLLKERQIYKNSPMISMKKLKFIKNTFGVTLSSVLLSSLSAAVAKSLSDIRSDQKWESIRITTLFPTESYRNKLRNLTLPTVYELDTPLHKNAKDRLLLTERNYQKAKHSFVTKFLYPITKIFSASLAASFARFPRGRSRVPVSASNFPGTVQIGLDNERKAIDFYAGMGIVSDMVFIMLSYNGVMRINVTVDGSFMDRNQLDDLIETFCSEVQSLYEKAIRECNDNNE